MLIMIVWMDGPTKQSQDLSRVEKPGINVLTDQIMRDMILEECFSLPVEQLEPELQAELKDVFIPYIEDDTAVWTDSSTDVTYTFILIKEKQHEHS